MPAVPAAPPTRRDLLTLIGAAAGGSTLYMAMSALGHAAESDYAGPIRLDGTPKGSSVLILGAGLAGLVAAFELAAPATGSRCWNTMTGSAGGTGRCAAATATPSWAGRASSAASTKGSTSTPAPGGFPIITAGSWTIAAGWAWRSSRSSRSTTTPICTASGSFGGKPQRYREIVADFHGHVAELLAKAARQNRLDEAVTREDPENLLEALKGWGALDQEYRYVGGPLASDRRGWRKPPGGGLDALPVPSEPWTWAIS